MKWNIASLPTSRYVSKQHSYRSYHPIEQWLGVMKETGDWGFEKRSSRLVLFIMLQPSSSHSSSNLNSYKGKKICRGACFFRKVGLIFCILCVNCSSVCDNGCQQDWHDDDDALGDHDLLQ